MARVCPLFSSSKGNSTYIGSASTGILVDMGVSYRALCQALSLCGQALESIQGIFITHEHCDHIKGLKLFTKYHDVPILATRETLEYLIAKDCVSASARLFEMGDDPVQVAGMQVRSFDTPHDAAHSVGYRIQTADDRMVCVCTDVGHITEVVDANLKGSDMVLLESNYDENMLYAGRYPWQLKRRIASPHGHLSNDDSALYLCELGEYGTAHFILGHLSEENNTPELAVQNALHMLSQHNFKQNRDFTLNVAERSTTGKVYIV